MRYFCTFSCLTLIYRRTTIFFSDTSAAIQDHRIKMTMLRFYSGAPLYVSSGAPVILYLRNLSRYNIWRKDRRTHRSTDRWTYAIPTRTVLKQHSKGTVYIPGLNWKLFVQTSAKACTTGILRAAWNVIWICSLFQFNGCFCLSNERTAFYFWVIFTAVLVIYQASF